MNPSAAIKRILRHVGIDIRRHIPGSSPGAQLLAICKARSIDLILDVGANAGQFAAELRASGYKGRIVSFEPLTHAYEKLVRSSHNDDGWIVHRRCAIGSEPGSVEINVAANSVSSSILPMLEAHRSAAPASAYCGKETVPVETIDAVAPTYLHDARSVMLKIDTQGYEWQVLDGAVATLPRITAVLIEMSLVPLYEGQHLWLEIIARLEAMGFKTWSLQPGFVDPSTGRTLQVDGMFCRP